MLRWCRRQAGLVATVMMAATVALSGATIVPHADDCHGECGQFAVAHDASAHRIGSAPEDAGPHNHCLVCHWARAFRPRAEVRTAASTPEISRPSVLCESFAIPSDARYARPPLRSPPSAFALS